MHLVFCLIFNEFPKEGREKDSPGWLPTEAKVSDASDQRKTQIDAHNK